MDSSHNASNKRDYSGQDKYFHWNYTTSEDDSHSEAGTASETSPNYSHDVSTFTPTRLEWPTSDRVEDDFYEEPYDLFNKISSPIHDSLSDPVTNDT